MSTYSTGDGAGLTKHLVHAVTDPISAHGHRVKKQAKHEAAKAEAHARQEHFVKGQQTHEVALTNLNHSHSLEAKSVDHSHEEKMLKLAHTLHRSTVRSEQKAGVTEGNTTFSTATVQANGGHRQFGSVSAAPAPSKPTTVKSTPAARPAASKPVTIGSKKPRVTKTTQKPAGSTSVHFQAP